VERNLQRTKQGRRETVLLDGLHQLVAFVGKIRVAAGAEVLNEPRWVRPMAIGDPEDGAGRTRNASLGERANGTELGAISALGNDLGEQEKEGLVKLKRDDEETRTIELCSINFITRPSSTPKGVSETCGSRRWPWSS
jgi:hypothetical protein